MFNAFENWPIMMWNWSYTYHWYHITDEKCSQRRFFVVVLMEAQEKREIKICSLYTDKMVPPHTYLNVHVDHMNWLIMNGFFGFHKFNHLIVDTFLCCNNYVESVGASLKLETEQVLLQMCSLGLGKIILSSRINVLNLSFASSSK